MEVEGEGEGEEEENLLLLKVQATNSQLRRGVEEEEEVVVMVAARLYWYSAHWKNGEERILEWLPAELSTSLNWKIEDGKIKMTTW